MSARLSRHDYFLKMAELVARRSTCSRRSVGCVLTNEHGHVIGTGYNGVPRNMPHCIDQPCAGACAKSGTDLDACQAVHAEINALLQCGDVEAINTIYLTCSPCVQCCKALMNTGAKLLVFSSEYKGWADGLDQLWKQAGKQALLRVPE